MEPREEVTVKLYLTKEELKAFQEMTEAVKEDDPIALKDWNIDCEVQFLCTNAIQKWNKKRGEKK